MTFQIGRLFNRSGHLGQNCIFSEVVPSPMFWGVLVFNLKLLHFTLDGVLTDRILRKCSEGWNEVERQVPPPCPPTVGLYRIMKSWWAGLVLQAWLWPMASVLAASAMGPAVAVCTLCGGMFLRQAGPLLGTTRTINFTMTNTTADGCVQGWVAG